jgi:hypothetical protein
MILNRMESLMKKNIRLKIGKVGSTRLRYF